jgi:hypothetical protein
LVNTAKPTVRTPVRQRNRDHAGNVTLVLRASAIPSITRFNAD